MNDKPEHYEEAVKFVRASQIASVSYLMRMLRIGHTRASEMVDRMEQEGLIGSSEGNAPRKVYIK